MTRKCSTYAVAIASAIGLALPLLVLASTRPEAAGAQTNEVVTKEFKYVKHAEGLTLPAGVSRITIVAAGGKGGKGAYSSGNGGAGIQVTAKDIQVGAERDIQVLVGGNGEHGGISKDRGGTGGFNGGGDAGATSGGGGGGGFTQVVSSPSNKVLVQAAGGGGGGGGLTERGPRRTERRVTQRHEWLWRLGRRRRRGRGHIERRRRRRAQQEPAHSGRPRRREVRRRQGRPRCVAPAPIRGRRGWRRLLRWGRRGRRRHIRRGWRGRLELRGAERHDHGDPGSRRARREDLVRSRSPAATASTRAGPRMRAAQHREGR